MAVPQSLKYRMLHNWAELYSRQLKAGKGVRAHFERGDYKQVVYYWFQQRGRIITNEYLVKWYLFLDGLTRHRTDGALVRLTTMVQPTEDWHDADARLGSFAGQVVPLLRDYVPE